MFCINCGLDLCQYLEKKDEGKKSLGRKEQHTINKVNNAGFEKVEKEEEQRDIPNNTSTKHVFNSVEEEKKIIDKGENGRTFSVSKIPLAPMLFPDWFDLSRPYRGKWAYYITESEWKSRPEIEKLRTLSESGRVANNIDDIDEVFDLAKGFLPETIEWNENNTINMPGCKVNGRNFTQKNAYDIRYYSFIEMGVEAAWYKWTHGISFSRKYIATALWETWLAWFNLSADMTPLGENLQSILSKEDVMKWFSYKLAVTGVKRTFDEASQSVEYIPVYTNQYALINFMRSSKRLFLDKSFLHFSRLIFITYPNNTIAGEYLDAQENPVEKMDFMYLAIYARMSEEYWLDAFLRNKGMTDQKCEPPKYFQYSKPFVEIIQKDLEIMGCSDLCKSEQSPFRVGNDVRFKDIYNVIVSVQSLHSAIGVTVERLSERIDVLTRLVENAE